MGKSTKTITHLGSDAVSVVTGGSLNLEKMRFNVPFSGAAVGQFLKSMSNIGTLEQARGTMDDFFSSKVMRIFETVAGAVALTVVTAGVASYLAAPAAVAGAAPAAEGGLAGLAAGAAPGTTLVAAPVAGTIPLAAGVAPTAAEVAAVSLPGIGAGVGPMAAASPFAGPAVAGSTGLSGLPTIAKNVTAAPAFETGFTQAMAKGAGTAANVAEATGSETAVLRSAMTKLDGVSTANPAGMEKAIANLTPAERAVAERAASNSGLMYGLLGAAGIQAAGGALGGIFQGKSAQKQLDLQRLINSQAWQQTQYKNANNQYAPLITFNHGGLVQQGA